MIELVDWMSHKGLLRLGAQSRELEGAGGRLHAYDLKGEGRGPTFVLVHGVGTRGTTFLPLVGRLKKTASRIVIPDLPAHGRSAFPSGGLSVASLTQSARDGLDKLLEGSPPAVFLGNSLGGAVSLGYALERPERVAGLVLASPGGAPLSEEELRDLRARFGLRNRQDARKFLAALLHRPPWYLKLLEPGIARQIGGPVVQDFLRGIAPEDFFTSEQLRGLKPPAVVIWGKSDGVLPRTGLSFYRGALPTRTRFLEPEGVGHSPHFERPDLLLEQLLQMAGAVAPQRS